MKYRITLKDPNGKTDSRILEGDIGSIYLCDMSVLLDIWPDFGSGLDGFGSLSIDQIEPEPDLYYVTVRNHHDGGNEPTDQETKYLLQAGPVWDVLVSGVLTAD